MNAQAKSLVVFDGTPLRIGDVHAIARGFTELYLRVETEFQARIQSGAYFHARHWALYE